MTDNMNIQWYPGHMTKTRRQIEADLKLVDAVCEIVDARIPVSSRNPDIDAICGDKPRMIVLNRMDLADPAATKKWAEYFQAQRHGGHRHGLQIEKGNFLIYPCGTAEPVPKSWNGTAKTGRWTGPFG